MATKAYKLVLGSNNLWSSSTVEGMAGVVYRKVGWRRSDPGIHDGMGGSLDILNGIIKKQRWKNDGKMRGTAGWVVDTESSNAVSNKINLRNKPKVTPQSDDVEESI